MSQLIVVLDIRNWLLTLACILLLVSIIYGIYSQRRKNKVFDEKMKILHKDVADYIMNKTVKEKE